MEQRNPIADLRDDLEVITALLYAVLETHPNRSELRAKFALQAEGAIAKARGINVTPKPDLDRMAFQIRRWMEMIPDTSGS
jgi:hypothetical protein